MVGFVLLFPPWGVELVAGSSSPLSLPLALSMAAQGHARPSPHAAAVVACWFADAECWCRVLRASSRSWWFFVLFVLVRVWRLVLIAVWWRGSTEI